VTAPTSLPTDLSGSVFDGDTRVQIPIAEAAD
jgi:hypothetical protein